MQQDRWDAFFLAQARAVAETFSKDPARKVGAVIYRDSYPLSFGYNGIIRGYPDDMVAPTDKLIYTEHAEKNAIFNAARNNINIMGASIACTFHPCHECARAIVQSGIKRVICPPPSDDDMIGKWASSIDAATRMFSICGVEVFFVCKPDIQVLHVNP